MTFYHPFSPSVSLKSKTLIVPVVSIGNVPQLAVDLLITTFDLKQIGIFDSRDLVPVVGPREEGPGVSTPLELYGKDGVDIVVVQQRSPVLKMHKEAFSTALVKFVQKNELGALLYLTGVDLSNRSDAQMLAPTYSLIPPPAPSKSENIPFIPGGGLTRRLLSLAPSSTPWKVPTAAILQFVLEGDNRADAEFLAGVVARVLKLSVAQWKQPGSWSVGLFGTPHDQTLYG
ncbi:PAC2 family-domain-containing protein [Phellopilus nigrolimitatus]|nr:PAC2 family-domain-containing protein [Phellopilus nigrolimitatus]